MSVNSYLTQISSKLVLSDAEKNSINRSINSLQIRINSYFGQSAINHFQFGSSTRGTILPGKVDSRSDIDYMIVFNSSDDEGNPYTYIDQLRRFVNMEYSTLEILQSSSKILLYLNGINFELVPAIGSSGAYKIPSPKSGWTDWMSTDPASMKNTFLEKNKMNHNNIKPLIRLAKYWNAVNNHPYTSFSLERHIVDRYFLCCTSLKDYFYSFWDDVSYGFNTARHIMDMIDSVKKHINRAREYERDNMQASAEKVIKKIIPAL